MSRHLFGPGSLSGFADDEPDTTPRKVKRCDTHGPYSIDAPNGCPRCIEAAREVHFKHGGVRHHQVIGSLGGKASAAAARARKGDDGTA